MLLSINKKRRLGSVILVVGGFKSRKMERFGVISFMVFERNSGGFLFFFFAALKHLYGAVRRTRRVDLLVFRP